MKKKLPITLHTALVFAVLLSIVSLASCGRACNANKPGNGTSTANTPERAPTPQGNSSLDPPKVEPVEKDDSVATAGTTLTNQIKASVRQLLSTVFRIRGSERLLRADRTYPLKTGDRIKTNDSGTARVKIGDCMTVYVFAASGLTLSSCPGFAPGSAVCSSSGTSLFNNRCRSHIRKVETDTAEIRLEGTYFRVAYWPEKKRTIIDVHEGPVIVRQLLNAVGRKFDKPVEIKEGCWCAPSDQCFLPGVPSDGPQPCAKLTAENAAYLDSTTKQTLEQVTRDQTPIAPAPTLDGVASYFHPIFNRQFNDLKFGDVEVGSETVKTLTITNISTLPLKINSVSLNDPIRYFQIKNDSCLNQELAMGKRCRIDVSFKPLDLGVFVKSLIISDNSKGSPRSVMLDGKAIPGWASTTWFEPLSLVFEQQPIGTTSASQKILVNKPKPTAPPVLEGPAKNDFKIVSNNCTNETVRCEIEVVFTPTEAGEREATLVFSPQPGSSGAVGSKKVGLRGVSTPKPNDVAAVLTPILKLPTKELCFNAHKVVDPKKVSVRKTETIPLTNAGKGPLLVTQIIPSTRDFVVQPQNCIGQTITERCDISVGFTPTATGVRSGTLTILSNDPANAKQEVQLGGRGKDRNWFMRGLQWVFRINQGDECKF